MCRFVEKGNISLIRTQARAGFLLKRDYNY